MTEIERILQKGIITPEFLQAETICDFYVDEKRKKIWAVLLDLLYEFDKVCQKYHLRYFAYAGTLLGAVRHKGFIPWDDDLDVFMFRDDYEELMKHADEFQAPYLLQSPYTDKGCYWSFVKIRNSNTACVSDVFAFEDWNMGIFLDVFPVDESIRDTLPDKYEKIGALTSEIATYMRMSNPYLDEANKRRVEGFCGRDPLEMYEQVQQIAKEDAGDARCDCYAAVVFTGNYKILNKIILKPEVRETIYLDFEGLKIPTFAGYENYLMRLYGDYMQLPPPEKRGEWHGDITFDPDQSYKTLIAKKRKEKNTENQS